MKIFDFPMRRTYYLRHPFKFCRTLARSLKNASMRIKLGYCNDDVWNMDHWFLETIPPMLRKLAKDGIASPQQYETREAWAAELCDIAAKLESAKESEQNKKNEFYQEYSESINNDKMLIKNFLKRAQELENEGVENFKEGLNEFRDIFFDLWD